MRIGTLNFMFCRESFHKSILPLSFQYKFYSFSWMYQLVAQTHGHTCKLVNCSNSEIYRISDYERKNQKNDGFLKVPLLFTHVFPATKLVNY